MIVFAQNKMAGRLSRLLRANAKNILLVLLWTQVKHLNISASCEHHYPNYFFLAKTHSSGLFNQMEKCYGSNEKLKQR
jgi:hypothetical protein